MKTQFWILTLSFCLHHIGFAHEVVVHRTITKHAADSALAYSAAYADFLNTVSTDCASNTAVASMVNGSDYEDTEGGDGGKRSLNHFYDPLTGDGLSNIPPDDRMSPFGRDSFTWASTFDCLGINFWIAGIGANVNTHNDWSWQNARDYERLGLTATNRSERQAALSDMFRSVGQVVHLLEDASEPEHVRNEQHLWPSSPIEKYGKKNNLQLNYQHGMLPWRDDGFIKLEDFWTKHLYTGNSAQPLNDDADTNQPAKALGLAEFSNGNFLGARHQYAEYFRLGSVEYYPFPSRDKSTNYKQVKANPSIGIDTYILENGHQGKGIYIAKNGDGVTVTHHSRINYLGAKISGLTGRPYCTINDSNVLHDYHDILIPKAVKYSAGILDYFFRGTISVSVIGYDTNLLQYTNLIVNTSGQDFSGGGFQLFWDDANGERTEIQSPDFTTTYADALANGASIYAVFVPHTNAVSYMLVYIGTIGTTNGTAIDLVDAGISIASKRFDIVCPDWTQLSWTSPNINGQGTFDTVQDRFSVRLHVTATGYGDWWIRDAVGSFTNTGTACPCQIQITNYVVSSPGIFYGDTGFVILQDGVEIAQFRLGDYDPAPSSVEIPFTVSAGTNSLFEIRQFDSSYLRKGYAQGELGWSDDDLTYDVRIVNRQ